MGGAPEWVVWAVGLVSIITAGAVVLRAVVAVVKREWSGPRSGLACAVDGPRMQQEFGACRENREAAAVRGEAHTQLLQEILEELRSLREQMHADNLRMASDLRVLLERADRRRA